MAVIPRTRAGLIKTRPVRAGSRIAVVAPASSFERAGFDAGIVELRRLGLVPVYDESIFERRLFTAGAADVRAQAMQRACEQLGADAVIAARGGYGSLEILPLLDADGLRRARTAFVGYSDVTSVHSYFSATVGLTSVHGAMIDGRLGTGVTAYDPDSFLRSLSDEPLGEMTAEGLEILSPGDARGPLVGGTLTQLLASFETPFAFRPPTGHVLLVDEVGERPYRLHRMLTQYRQSGRLAEAVAIVFGQLPRCDEPGLTVSARDAVRDVLSGFAGPVLFGFPTGHTVTPCVSVPLGVDVRVVAEGEAPRLVFTEAAAAE